MAKVMVVGGTGLVGNSLVRTWVEKGADVSAATYHCHRASRFLQLDIQDVDKVNRLLEAIRPSVVAVPAANPYVDDCERRPLETRKLNVVGTLNAARACRAVGAKMIFFSSDYVFDGRRGQYKEADPIHPLNEYGRQKAETEAGVLEVSPNNLVVRTSGAFGWQWEPKNFVLQIVSRLGKGERMVVANDVVYNPTYVEDLAEAVVRLIAAGAHGIYHVVGSEGLPRHEFARLTALAFGLDARLISPVPVASLGAPAARPADSRLICDKLFRAVQFRPGGPEESLRRMRAMERQWRTYATTLPDPAEKELPSGG